MINENTIYLDYQASTPVRKEVFEAMRPYFSELYGNPHSNAHVKGWEANKAVERARDQVANAISADNDEIIFTSGATESNNLAIKGIAKHLKQTGKTTVLVSSIEHKCVLESAASMQEQGFEVRYVRPNKEGIITSDALKQAMTDDVGLVSIMLVNNEIGTIQPIRDLAKIAHDNRSLFHTDAAQAPVFMDIDVVDLNVDFMSLSSHKVYGPKGVGLLYVARDLKSVLRPLIHGGGQEDGLRSGTLPTALCVGMGEAMKLASENSQVNAKKLKALSELFWQGLKQQIPNIELNGSANLRHPGNLNIYFPGIESSNFLQLLQPSVAASTGSACNSGIESPSYVLAEIGLRAEKAGASIRFSFGVNQKPETVKEAVYFINGAYKKYTTADNPTFGKRETRNVS